MDKCISLNEKLVTMDNDLQVNPQYVQRVCCVFYILLYLQNIW